MTTSRDEFKAAAYELGKLLATVGDFYDVANALAVGWAEGNGGDAAKDRERHLRLQLSALNELHSVAGNVLADRVQDARDELLPWSVIGEALDTSKQAVQQRYGKQPRG